MPVKCGRKPHRVTFRLASVAVPPWDIYCSWDDEGRLWRFAHLTYWLSIIFQAGHQGRRRAAGGFKNLTIFMMNNICDLSPARAGGPVPGIDYWLSLMDIFTSHHGGGVRKYSMFHLKALDLILWKIFV